MTARAFVLTIAALATYKGLELAITVDLLLGLPMILGGLVSVAHPRIGMGAVAATALLVNTTPFYRNHLALLMWIALTVALFGDDRQQRLLLRCTLTIMYGFAALAKVWPDWLSGEALVARTWIGPLPTAILSVTSRRAVSITATASSSRSTMKPRSASMIEMARSRTALSTPEKSRAVSTVCEISNRAARRWSRFATASPFTCIFTRTLARICSVPKQSSL